MTYLITFACYGCHLHGDESGSIDRWHNRYGGPGVAADPTRTTIERQRMDQAPYIMDTSRRETVLSALGERCAARGWNLLAAHVRGNHVHVVVQAETPPERVMNDLKSFASRCLNNRNIDEPSRKRWGRHGSTRWLWTRETLAAAIHYVVEQQGEPMSVFRSVDDS